jgi:hypothetical protein
MTDSKVTPEDFKTLFKSADDVSNGEFNKLAEAGAGLILDTLKEPGITGRAETAHAAAMERFEHADYFSVGDDQETLSHTEWSECLGQHFDDTAEKTTHIKVQCDELAPLEICGWKRKTLHKGFAEGVIDSMIEDLLTDSFHAENWWEEYGDPDGDHPPLDGAKTKDVDPLKDKLSAILHDFMLEHTTIWQCDVTATKEFTVDELEEFAKLNYPNEWNEPDA